MLAVLRFREWVLGLFRAGVGAPPVVPPSPVAQPLVAPAEEPVLVPPLAHEERSAPMPAKKPRRRRKKWNEVSAWNARLRSPLVDE
ncbi:hypothetical protein LXT21_44485 [Myxococcus sp. K38C18041901]|uniref:hypothetical protein n=1 Tax=Myxococcus guangdongensis TaxID=2906760 RepID=UPI0020A7D8C9|nr:hypothetical protein [Myxococcus guangdongensis]MCP3065849.1 hypothetical protein [Myxococcus guangdongensis]